MKRYVQQKLFDCGAVLIARMHLLKGTDLDHVAAYVANGYKGSYADDNLMIKWEAAALEALKLCKQLQLADSDTDAILFAYRHYANYFDEEGRRIPFFRRIGGTRFHYERAAIPNLVESFRDRFSRFAIMGKAGILRSEWLPTSGRR